MVESVEFKPTSPWSLGCVTLKMQRPTQPGDRKRAGELPRKPGGKDRATADPIDLERLHAHDPALLTEIVREVSPRIWMAIRRFARDDDHADDLLQDCWVRILQSMHRFKGHGSFTAWAIAVSKNVCRMHLRRERREGVLKVALESVEHLISREPDLTEAEDLPTTAESLQQLRRQAVYRALGRLPDIERNAIVLRLLEGRNTAETARVLHVSEAAVRSSLLRGVNRLKRMEEVRELLPEWMGWN